MKDDRPDAVYLRDQLQPHFEEIGLKALFHHVHVSNFSETLAILSSLEEDKKGKGLALIQKYLSLEELLKGYCPRYDRNSGWEVLKNG